MSSAALPGMLLISPPHGGSKKLVPLPIPHGGQRTARPTFPVSPKIQTLLVAIRAERPGRFYSAAKTRKE